MSVEKLSVWKRDFPWRHPSEQLRAASVSLAAVLSCIGITTVFLNFSNWYLAGLGFFFVGFAAPSIRRWMPGAYMKVFLTVLLGVWMCAAMRWTFFGNEAMLGIWLFITLMLLSLRILK